MSRQSGLVAALIDDAAVFPPGNAPIEAAAAAHYAFRDTPYEVVVGPLLVPASGVENLRMAVDPAAHLAIGLIGDTGLEGLVAARDAVQDDAWLEVQQMELRLPTSEDPGTAVRHLLKALPFTVPSYIELAPEIDFEAALAVLADDGVERAKFRCGPDDVPSSRTLAAFIKGCVKHWVPFKLTAGLHHALPHRDLATGITQHGYLNTLAATWAAIAGESAASVASLLEATDADHILGVLADADVARLRRTYRSFGSCSITEPYDELVDLKLLDEGEL